MKKLIAGNWKMNGDAKAAEALVTGVEEAIAATPGVLGQCDFVVCPPFVHIPMVHDKASVVAIGGQDCSRHISGAYTGDTSPAMLKDVGASYVILGHSERRQYQSESDELVAAKAKCANEAGLITIICVGETDAEREANLQESVVGGQLERSIPEAATAENTVIAYEPVWAIGTGKTATPEDIRAMHGFIREKMGRIPQIRILYGGSVKPSNAKEIFSVPNVDGALIGGASLKAEDFLGIAEAA
ncbi:MAG: triose-phosphate isomerase [Micavibrio aeruginosavorus]|uniref:Triosephosphate isomerase n=1 Tax=Micavibrio aeruginosavorus TaxID=349221 RepID=A0A2W4ZXY2_9BACT|nr:MAG: triose-phosphate isomerase [Micavibrio aeruginosavorus]